MKGFLRRDICLLGLNVKFYLVFLLAMGVLSLAGSFNVGFLALYVVIFCATALVGLFSYDEADRWQGYAAAFPEGRRAMVDARYVTALLLSAAATALLLVFSLLRKTGAGWALAPMYGALMLVYVDIVFPLSYRFGTKSRLIMVIVVAAIAGAVGVGAGALSVSGGPEAGVGSLVPAAGGLALAGLAASWVISRRIMAGKEF